ncbi:MAG: DUF4230 domain-containing protein [Saprospiraceae bacterium]|nr:DUF4230 domain-containing protein [Saprospiraceae bacterium]
MRNLLCALLCMICLLIGYQLGKYLHSDQQHKTQDSTTILHSIKDVLKIATVEAEISELITQKSYTFLDISPFRKSIILRVRAKAAAGFDLDSSAILIDEQSKLVQIKMPGPAKILYIDQKIDYYDLQQGTFNSFSAQELSLLNEKARDIILRSLDKTDLLARASERKTDLLKNIEQLLQASGYKMQASEQVPEKIKM